MYFFKTFLEKLRKNTPHRIVTQRHTTTAPQQHTQKPLTLSDRYQRAYILRSHTATQVKPLTPPNTEPKPATHDTKATQYISPETDK